MASLGTFYAALTSWRIAVLATGVTLIFAVVLFPASAKRFRPADGKHIIYLQLAFSVDRFREILLGWARAIPDSMKWLKQSILKLDYLFPVLYATAFASVYAVLSANDTPSSWDVFFVTAPFFAGFFDWIENTVHLIILRGIHTASDIQSASFNSMLIKFASSAASIKFLLLTANVAGWIVSIVQVLL